MVGWLREEEGAPFFPKAHPVRILDFPLLEVALPPAKPGKSGERQRESGERQRKNGEKQRKSGEKQGARGAKILKKQGVFRALMPPKWEEGAQKQGLFPVQALPLYRALGGRLCLKLLEEVPPRRRRVALRGEKVDATARAMALALCPHTALILEFEEGEEPLAQQLQRTYGAPPLGQAWGAGAQVVVELAPPAAEAPLPPGTLKLKLWGEPDLAGLTLNCPGELPPELPQDPFLALLWESGRLKLGEIGLSGP